MTHPELKSRRAGGVLRVLLCLIVLGAVPGQALAQRARGVDISEFQGTMNWNTTWNAGIRFAFIRSSRGGTTGSSDNDGDNTFGAGRYDDPRFVTNMTGATNRGILAAPYHYARPDTIALENAQPSNATVQAAARDEAAHFVERAGAYMAPGHLRPVLDLEERGGASGTNPDSDALTAAKLTLWANTFLDEVQSLTGVEPIIYLNTDYATSRVTTALNTRDLWIARWNDDNSGNVNPHTDQPETPGGFPNPYGVWNDPIGGAPSHASWSFWQYTSTGVGSTYGASSTRIDLDAFNGDVSLLQSFVIQAPEPTGLGALAAGVVLTATRRRRAA